MKRVNIMKQGTTAKIVGWPCVLHHFQCYHMAGDLGALKGIKVQQVANKCLNVKFQWL
jgi:hypothetical protein